jgi:hypothetical protein
VDRLVALEELRASQHGVVRRDQLRALDWTRHHVAHEIEYDRWQQVAPEVIAMQNAPLIHQQRLWLGVLHAGPNSALSHSTVLQVAGLTHWETDVIDVISNKGNTMEPLDLFFFHETRRDYQAWVHPTRLPRQLRVEEAALLAAERKRSPRSGIGLLAASVTQRITTAERLFLSSRDISKLRHGCHFRLASRTSPVEPSHCLRSTSAGSAATSDSAPQLGNESERTVVGGHGTSTANGNWRMGASSSSRSTAGSTSTPSTGGTT